MTGLGIAEGDSIARLAVHRLAKAAHGLPLVWQISYSLVLP